MTVPPVTAPVPIAAPPGGLDQEPHVDGARLLLGIAELAEIGALPTGGITRLAFTPEEDRARAYLMERARRADLRARVDEAGNVVIRRRDAEPGMPALLMGSHMDTVVKGGRLDGAYGVLAALEVLTVLAERDEPLGLEPVAIAFTNEEAGLFPYPFFGSRGVAGTLDPSLRYSSRDGTNLRPVLARAGGDLSRIRDAAWARGSIGAYLEAHIEQGPYLERAGIPVGVVTTITGRVTFDLRIQGRSSHAGTTPMDDRADALVAASHAVLAVEDLARSGECAVATVGQVESHPDQINVIPGNVRLAGEIRDLSGDRLTAAQAALARVADEIGGRYRVRVRVRTTGRVEPVPTTDVLRQVVRDAARELGLATMDLPSGAGHDAQVVAEIAPIGMVFVPSRAGISHAPEEDTDPEQLVTGADVLLRAALELCRRAREPGWSR
ncbi:Zn-dependent hydrolase [Catenulispora sp. NF23]|uniref:Zn-dependent hydrolase n=1 Tax=Catenulispora pinistramenti TaxID=2705254 RepID=A0ABS5KMA0_9ACTN|nr:Zn-dependent hydrolase [Catenulispora pinistramenti]MBS2532118.1 Zn-dependent hydrolase [Catenulispora pinistramenti]MBS2547160.1 Zn-dependent hydrolase [Catenulispora pinistramenti]